MSAITAPIRQSTPRRQRTPPAVGHATRIRVGPIGRLGRWTATHFRAVLSAWLVIAVVLGLFAPKVETALSGAGWEASGSQSAQARKLIERDFQGLGGYGLETVVYSPRETASDPRFKAVVARVEGLLRSSSAVRTVVGPTPGISISRDGHTAIVQGGAAKNPKRNGPRGGQTQGQTARPLHERRGREPHRRAGDVV